MKILLFSTIWQSFLYIYINFFEIQPLPKIDRNKKREIEIEKHNFSSISSRKWRQIYRMVHTRKLATTFQYSWASGRSPHSFNGEKWGWGRHSFSLCECLMWDGNEFRSRGCLFGVEPSSSLIREFARENQQRMKNDY